MKPQEKIREIWDEMKELKRLTENGNPEGDGFKASRTGYLEKKYEEIETLFGHESTLSKAIIYYINKYLAI